MRPKSGTKSGFPAFSLLLFKKRENLIKLIFHIGWLHRIFFIYNATASFFRDRIVKWPWIGFKMRSILFKKFSIFFYFNVVWCPVKLVCLSKICFQASSVFTGIYGSNISRNSFLKENYSIFNMIYLFTYLSNIHKLSLDK